MNPEIDVFGGMVGRTYRNGICTVVTGKESSKKPERWDDIVIREGSIEGTM